VDYRASQARLENTRLTALRPPLHRGGQKEGLQIAAEARRDDEERTRRRKAKGTRKAKRQEKCEVRRRNELGPGGVALAV
jgi:hypothetical protein